MVKNFGKMATGIVDALTPKAATKHYGNAAQAINAMGKNVNKSIGSNKPVGQGVMNVLGNIDNSMLGGTGHKIADAIKDNTGGSSMLKGLKPGPDEFKPIKRTFTPEQASMKGEAFTEAIKHANTSSSHLDQLQKLANATQDLDGDAFANKLKEIGQIKVGDSSFDYTGYDKAGLNQVLEQTKKAKSSWLEQADQVGQGFYMQEQNGLEKTMSYFTNKTHGKKRAMAAGVGVGAMALGGRFATGGSLTRNGDGERDIVGVPFI